MPKRTYQPNVRHRAKVHGVRAKMKTPGGRRVLKSRRQKGRWRLTPEYFPLDQRFRWDERLHRKSDFTRVFKEGHRVGASGLTMWSYRSLDEEAGRKPRLGLAIPKAYGNAVARNRLKRLIRETFRINKAKLPPGVDIVFSARSALGKPRYQTIEPLVLKLWTQAKLLPSPLAS